ncbi:uncharacterized protein LOC110927036 isoform X2 [Helianthus annuus]|uniref:uncharacterized protein LOC110927036 isoform X2 n=1 Tax=Helianthus annuus TaxID=4232 RepID=UPI001652E19D|nr:uncharacterized protein LOC110927036 isoform X2 [Helianthus annuus]
MASATFAHLQIPLEDVKNGTDNFAVSNIIGKGGFGAAYKGQLLRSGKSIKIAALRLDRKLGLGGLEFWNEISVLSDLKHTNLVSLIGFCDENREKIIVIKHEENGSLREHLNNPSLTLTQRLRISVGVARALSYLYHDEGRGYSVIHCNINTSTILLDHNWEAKLSGFTFSIKQSDSQIDQVVLCEPIGIAGYVDPAIEKIRGASHTSDIYSFGVVLCEMLCGREAFIPKHINSLLAPLVKDLIENHKLLDIIPLYLHNQMVSRSSWYGYAGAAYSCINDEPAHRPNIKYTLAVLEEALELQLKRENQILENNLEHFKTALRDIKSATENFSEKYGIKSDEDYNLYKAELDHFDVKNHSSVEENKGKHQKRHRTVVVKRFFYKFDPQGEERFYTNIRMLTSVKHRNIVTLLGFCVEACEMILVIENSHEYLNDALMNIQVRTLTWEKRLKICIDVAHALKYLHSKMIIHRDICPWTIVLDENLGAKIDDFFYSVLIPTYQDKLLCLESNGREFYYIDLEYEEDNKLKSAYDVYSFGVVLFEVLCGKLANHPIYLTESEKGLSHVVTQRYNIGTLKDMVDPLLNDETDENNIIQNRGPNQDSLDTFIAIAFRCMAKTQDKRPTMENVTQELEKALYFQEHQETPDVEQVVDKHEKTPERANESIHEERIQCPNPNQIVDELETALEAKSTHAIPKYKDNRKFSLIDIKCATQNFHDDNFVGGGGFGKVYKGNLQDSDRENTIVAKRLDTRLGQGEQQFWNELQILLEYKHENIIGLVGYCDEDEEKIIVYQYAPRGSLDMYLNNASLTWVERLNICIDVASALDFLHGGVGKQAKVIHRDIKTANILLNNDGKAKLADFGLSLISPITQKTYYVLDNVCGTLGYLDPHYKTTRFLTIESDIYSFGVVLFEILCGRSTYSTRKHQGKFLSGFIKNKFKEGKQDELVFEQIREQIDPKSLTIFQRIAYQCLHHEREKRPTTKKVLVELKKALEFQNMASTMTKLNHLHITLEDIITATNSFHNDNIIGHHGFGTTYIGQLSRSGTLLKIAARRFDSKHGEGDLKFLKEISMLSDLKHTNLVSIIGFSDEKDEKVIITKYEGNGSLGQYLNISNLTWTQRLRICVGVARALSYLHYDEGRDYTIIHGNVNSDAILLDENWEAKLSSFEFSIKHLVCYKDHVWLCEHTSTMGYMDPAIEKTGGVTHESDVYSFGVVLFETLCGRKAYVESEADRFLTPLAKYHYENKTMHDIIHPDLVIDPQSLIKYSAVAYSCLNEDRACRPGMNHIVGELEKALELQLSNENMGINLEYLKNLKIRLTDIIFATDNFSKKYIISSSPCYTCYTAKLKNFESQNHSSVVIKRFVSGQDFEHGEHFVKEIELLTRVKHPNIVTLLGFCIDASERILVLENFDNFFLDYHLIDTKKPFVLTWGQRLKICIDIAHALNYLHSQMIIHRDICSLNIELDQNWGAKISNFDNFIYLPPNQEDEALYLNKIAGRVYYVDPEYDKTGKLKRESDVYSFGVVLFEILCGRVANDSIYETGSAKGLVVAARRSFCAGTLEEMIDPILKGENGENNFVQDRGPNKDSLRTFIEIAYRCVAETQDQRPTMKVVVKELKKALFFQETS